MARLRPIPPSAGLTEGIERGRPCYCHDGRNVAIIQETKGPVANMLSPPDPDSAPAGPLEAGTQTIRACVQSAPTQNKE